MQPEVRRSRRGYAVRLAISVAALAVTALLLLNRQYVLDRATVFSYTPETEIVQLAERTSMSDEAEFYFYASQPELQGRGDFNQSCGSVQSEKTAVLGCYAGQRIFLYDVADARLDGIVEVTAAHEMLHAAYDRLSSQERGRIDALLEEASQRVNSPELERLMEEYAKTEPGERMNELHSILGTQYRTLGPELEQYYSQYFDSRLSVVGYYERYSAVFKKLEAQQEQLIRQLNNLAASIDTDIGRYNAAVEAYAAAVADYNARQYTSYAAAERDRQALLSERARLEQMRDSIEQRKDEYRRLSDQLSALNLQTIELNQSIDSSLAPLQEVR